MTSSDSMSTDKIGVSFSNVLGLARRPVFHTCGPVIELPCTYDSYPDLRKEFEAIVANEECFRMDIA